MNNKKIAQALLLISNAFAQLSEAFGTETETTAEVVEKKTESVGTEEIEEAPKTTKTPKNGIAKVSKTEEKSESNTSTELTEEGLSSMTYNDLKKLAKELGVSATGNRKELVARLLDTAKLLEDAVEDESEAETEEFEEESEEISEVEETEDDSEEESESDEEEDEESLIDEVAESVADWTDEEICETLESVGIKTKGKKRQSLISLLTSAIADGLLSFDDEEETEEESEEADEDESEDGDITANMTEERRQAYEELCDETNEQFESGELTREDLIDFINTFNGTKDKFKKVSDEDIVAMYLELASNLVSDDGEVVEEGAYTINDAPYCCGKPLKYVKKGNKYVCETCGSEYEADED